MASIRSFRWPVGVVAVKKIIAKRPFGFKRHSPGLALRNRVTISKVVTPGTSPRVSQNRSDDGRTDVRGLPSLQTAVGRIFRSDKKPHCDSWEKPTGPNRAE